MDYTYKIPKKYYYGSAITLIQEIIELNKKKNIKINLNLISKNKQYLDYFNIVKYLDLNIKIFKNSNNHNSVNLNNLLNKKISYSLQNLIKISKFRKKKPKINFKKKYINLVKDKLKKKNIKKFICVHIKENITKDNFRQIQSWEKLLKFMPKEYSIIFLKSDKYKKNFNKNKNVLFFDTKNIYIEPIMSQICKFFLASASGFCSFAVFSNVPYLLIKNPKEHVRQIKSELKFNRLKFASYKQYLIREKIDNTKKILSYVKKIK